MRNPVIPGRARREPGIHNHDCLWIPGLRQEAHPGMTALVYATMIRLRSSVREERPSCRNSFASERRASGA